jgi:hypothetical protein
MRFVSRQTCLVGGLAVLLAASFAQADRPVRRTGQKTRPAAAPGQGAHHAAPGHAAPAQAGKNSRAKVRQREHGLIVQARRGSAAAALGIRLAQGVRWSVAWSQRKLARILKRDIRNIRARGPVFGRPYVIDYQVTKAHVRRVAGMDVPLYTIEMHNRQPAGTSRSLRAEIVVDGSFSPVSERLFGINTPYGVRRDKNSSNLILKVGTYPMPVGNLKAEPIVRSRIEGLNPALGRYLSARCRQVGKVAVRQGRKVYGMSYWSPGLPYSCAFVSENLHGVLIDR